MEKEFRGFIVDRVNEVLKVDGRFKIAKKINLGADRPGSRVWRWMPNNDYCAYVAIEFYANSDYANIGVGWSKKNGGEIDFLSVNDACRKVVAENGYDLGALVGFDEVYIYKDVFGFGCAYFGPINSLIPVERARQLYKDPGVLKRVMETAGLGVEDWELYKPVRYWEIAKCFVQEPIVKEDCEYATGDVCQEMISFVEGYGLPYLVGVYEARQKCDS